MSGQPTRISIYLYIKFKKKVWKGGGNKIEGVELKKETRHPSNVMYWKLARLTPSALQLWAVSASP